jgi:nucleoside phosphorylase/outer membrane protein TolC
MKHILLCAATGVEARACRNAFSHPSESAFEVLQTGMGPVRAEKALRDYLSTAFQKPDCIVSTGFAGSRKSGIELGDWVLARKINSGDQASMEINFDPWSLMLRRAAVAYQAVSFHQVTEVVSEANASEASDVQVVDMESYALASVAKEFEIAFQVLRLISDTPEKPIPKAIIEFSNLSITAGLRETISAPKKLFTFIGQSMKLPAELTKAWKKIAPHVSQLFLLFTLISVFSSHAHAFSLDEYLTQVQHSHDGYRSLEQDSQGALAAAQTSNLLFKPQAFSAFQYTYDPRDTHDPALEGDKTVAQSISAGVREQTPWGLQLQLSLDYSLSTLIGTTSPLVTRPIVTNLYPVPVFNWSLWQNWGGRMDHANQRMQEAQSLAEAYGSDFSAKALLVEAEGRYWKLAALREVIRLQHDSLDRAKSVMDLDTRKAKQRLIDSGDTLLSEAAVQGKELELKSMLTEERSAARAFNSSRGIDSDQVEETLSLPSPESFAHLTLPNRAGTRGDLKVAEQQSIASEAGYDIANEKLKPNVNLFGSIFAMGLNFSVPLDLSLTSDSRQGYAKQAQAAELNYRRKQFEQESDWQEIRARFADNLERLQLAIKLEDLQRRNLRILEKDARAR